ncbi:MAG: hypothetical protein AAB930_03425, partial [Patescibacteria group bacterium]
MLETGFALSNNDTEAIIVAKAQAESASLVRWVYWMAMDILLSMQYSIEYRYVYWDRIKQRLVVCGRPVTRATPRRFEKFQAYVIIDDDKIFISPDAKDKALCLFHECLEVLFSEWKDEYFVPGRWGL